MKNLIKTIAIVSVLTATSAQAWWGNGVSDGAGAGEGSFGFNMNASAQSDVRGTGYGYNTPYYGYPVAPIAPIAIAPKAETK